MKSAIFENWTQILKTNRVYNMKIYCENNTADQENTSIIKNKNTHKITHMNNSDHVTENIHMNDLKKMNIV